MQIPPVGIVRHRDSNHGPSACDADVLPLRHRRTYGDDKIPHSLTHSLTPQRSSFRSEVWIVFIMMIIIIVIILY